jgi:hypothetical protein
MDPVPDPLLCRKSGSVGIEPGISGSVARNSDQTTEVVNFNHWLIKFETLSNF